VTGTAKHTRPSEKLWTFVAAAIAVPFVAGLPQSLSLHTPPTADRLCAR
jgi:hypothetical protein